jgi:hypothetical protein
MKVKWRDKKGIQTKYQSISEKLGVQNVVKETKMVTTRTEDGHK